MVNVYVFRTDGTTPTGWSEISAGYQNRLILSGGTMLETGGADSHNHNPSVSSVSTVGTGYIMTWSTTGAGMRYGGETHSHSVSGVSCNADNSLPSYKNLRVVYRSTTGWNGTLPAGSIVFRESVPTGYSRVDAGQSYFIRIASTAGGTGGNDTHAHWVSVALANFTSGSCRTTTSGQNLYVASCTHSHDWAGGASSWPAFDYRYWGCGLISADSDTLVRQDTYLLFDDTPDSNYWEVVSADGCYLKALGTYTPATGGTNTTFYHNHSFSFASAYSNTYWSKSSTVYQTYPNHTHTITGSLDYQTIQPSYVRFTVARAKVDFVTTLTVTYDFDTLVKKLDIYVSATADLVVKKLNMPASTNIDLLLKRLGLGAPADLDILLKKIADASWSMSAKLIPGGYDFDYDADTLLKKLGIEIQAQFDSVLLKRDIQMVLASDMLLKKLGLSASVNQDMFLLLQFEQRYSIDLLARETFQAAIDQDILLRRWGLSSPVQMDVVMKKTIRLGYLIEALFFGSADLVMQADIILSDRPTKHRPHRRYPSSPEVPVGEEEVHKESFDLAYGERHIRTYPEIETESPEADVHPESFDFEPPERRNRQIKTTYR